jgi:SWI/SNF-related matrix-associated actin-dependent regulator 1 of chromatin subfamily A
MVQTKGEQMNVTLHNNRISIAFPFDLVLLEIVRTLPDRAWNLKSHPGVWSVPATPFHCQSVIDTLTPRGFHIAPEVEKCADAKVSRPKLRSKLPKSLFGYQRDGIEHIHATNGRDLIADDMGLGKSAEALVWWHLFGGNRVLIVSPANVTWKWAEKEAALWAKDRTWQVVEGGKTPITDTDITIMSYRTMVMRYEELKGMPFDTMIFDEAHYLKSNKSQQNRVARKLVKGTPHVLLLTGTPFKNRRFELFQLLHILDPKVWSSAIEFGTRYCGGVFQQGHWIVPPYGQTNTEELQARLAPIMLRRTKKQVADDLPELTRVAIPIHLDNAKEYEKALRSAKEQARSEGYKPGRSLALLNTLRQVVGRGKVRAAIELAGDILETGEQVVLFAHHKENVDALQKGLLVTGHVARIIDGGTPAKERQQLSSDFIAGKFRILIVSSAGKEGLDLYSASHIIFVERLWTPADEEQIEARLHRKGQKNSVTAHYFIARGTVDEYMDDVVVGKRREFGGLIDTDEVVREVWNKVFA